MNSRAACGEKQGGQAAHLQSRSRSLQPMSDVHLTAGERAACTGVVSPPFPPLDLAQLLRACESCLYPCVFRQ